MVDGSSPVRVESKRRHRMVSAAWVTLVALSLVVLAVAVLRDSEWWCDRHAPSQLAELEAAGTSALEPASFEVHRFDKCPGGNGNHQVFFTVEQLNTREVGDRFRRQGWIGQNSLTSPNGRVLVKLSKASGPEYPGPYVAVTAFLKSDLH
jgi:hypothetical protein